LATKRKRRSNWEFIVRRKGLLPRPLYLTFDTEAEGDEYCRRLEALLDQGIVPDEVVSRTLPKPAGRFSLDDAITLYLAEVPVGKSDVPVLELIARRFGLDAIQAIDNAWTARFIGALKTKYNAAPTTIRHYVGALGRCLDWVVRNKPSLLATNPMRNLGRGYALYSPKDIAAAPRPRVDIERDRRLTSDEDERIREILGGKKPEGKQRPLELKFAPALRCFYTLALESAMRMREMYTLERRQIDFERRTIFLDATKNGSKRQVPMTSVAVQTLRGYLDEAQPRTDASDNSPHVMWVFPWFAGDFSDKSLRQTTSLLSRQFARVFEAAQCVDLRFHDLRHEATSRLYERTSLTDLQIAKITGHKTLSMLARYANLRGSDLADKLW